MAATLTRSRSAASAGAARVWPTSSCSAYSLSTQPAMSRRGTRLGTYKHKSISDKLPPNKRRILGRNHSVVLPLRCSMCDRDFKTQAEKSAHYNGVHRPKSTCYECDKTFASAACVLKHCINVHKISEATARSKIGMPPKKAKK